MKIEFPTGREFIVIEMPEVRGGLIFKESGDTFFLIVNKKLFRFDMKTTVLLPNLVRVVDFEVI